MTLQEGVASQRTRVSILPVSEELSKLIVSANEKYPSQSGTPSRLPVRSPEGDPTILGQEVTS